MSFLLVALVLTGTLVITIPTFKRVKIVRNDMSCLSIIIPARNEEKTLPFYCSHSSYRTLTLK